MSKVEKIGPTKEVIALTNEVLSQNRFILEMNRRLLEMLMSPLIVYDGNDPDFVLNVGKGIRKKQD